MTILLAFIYFKILKSRLKNCGGRSRSKVESKIKENQSCYLYFNFQQAIRRKPVHKNVYDHFNENDEIEITFDPKCPLYSFEIDTQKIPRDKLKGKHRCCYLIVGTFVFLVIFFFINAFILTWGLLKDDKNMFEMIVYYLCALMWAVPFAMIFFGITITFSCFMMKFKATSHTGNPSNPLLKTIHVQME